MYNYAVCPKHLLPSAHAVRMAVITRRVGKSIFVAVVMDDGAEVCSEAHDTSTDGWSSPNHNYEPVHDEPVFTSWPSYLPEGLGGWPWAEPAPDAATFAILIGLCFLLGFVSELLRGLQALPRAEASLTVQDPAPALPPPPPKDDLLVTSTAEHEPFTAARHGSSPPCPLAAEFPAIHPVNGRCRYVRALPVPQPCPQPCHTGLRPGAAHSGAPLTVCTRQAHLRLTNSHRPTAHPGRAGRAPGVSS